MAFYKTHRAIMSSDIIHVRRADHHGERRQWTDLHNIVLRTDVHAGVDAILHVNPSLPTKGLAMLFNPTSVPINGTLPLNLYYTSLTTAAKVTEGGRSGAR